MKGMIIYEGLTRIDDGFILGSTLPAAGAVAPKTRRESAFARFASSGWGVAVISCVVALGVLTAIILVGQREPTLPPVSTGNSTETTVETGTETATEPTTETEAVTEDTRIDTPEEAEARKDELIAILNGLDFKWNILADPAYYFSQYDPVKEFGVYGVPYMLDYIMEREGETDAEELKRLGVILHFAYHNLGITDTSEWYRPEPYSTDLFNNTMCLMEHLEEYRLKVNTEDSITSLSTNQYNPHLALEKNVAYSFNSLQQISHNSTQIKDQIYTLIESFNTTDYTSTGYFTGGNFPTPASYYCKEVYDIFASYGIEAVPYMAQYVLEHAPSYYETYNVPETHDMGFIIACAYEMLGAPNETSWINWNEEQYGSYSDYYARDLLIYFDVHGLRPIYPFISAEEAEANQDRITRQLEDSRYYFGWSLIRDLADYQYYASLITVFGKHAVPYILDYILSHEGQHLTPDEEMNLGVLLHCAYSMLGVETTADWHMPAEAVESTTDPFPYARELTAHLSEYGLEPAE